MMGYKDKLEKTLETIDEDGWVRSGDLGKLDKQGFFAVTGRIKELLITSGGENIPPFLIEDNIKELYHFKAPSCARKLRTAKSHFRTSCRIC